MRHNQETMEKAHPLCKIHTLLILFENELSQREIPAFRGAVAASVPRDLVLFHNHEGDTLRYRYPLIQYKRIGGKAALLCIGDGTEAISAFFQQQPLRLRIGQREEQFTVAKIQADQWLLQTWQSEFEYTLRKWLPFNQENYAAYQSAAGLAEQVQLLEKILTGNMLSLCTGLDVHIETNITCHITSILDQHIYSYKGVKMQGFDIAFRTNLLLADYIGLGKGVSHSFGIVHRNKERKQEQE